MQTMSSGHGMSEVQVSLGISDHFPLSLLNLTTSITKDTHEL